MGLVTGAIRDHAVKELDELRALRSELLEKAAAIGREIATIEALQVIGAEHAAAEGKANGLAPVKRPTDGKD